MGIQKTRLQTTCLFAASALTLAACASPPSASEDGVVQVSQGRGGAKAEEARGVVVTGSRMPRAPEVDAPTPPAPPPPPVGMVYGGGTYAQMASQPMPGDVNHDRYQAVGINGVKLVAQEPVLTFSIDVDTASYSNVRRMLDAGTCRRRMRCV